MIEPPELLDESDRINTLRSLEILDTPEEESFDRITRLAQMAFHAPISLISLVDTDRQWFKSRQGLDLIETRRRISFCGHAIAHEVDNDPGSKIFEVQDSMLDIRFYDNPLVTDDPNIRFYAGYVIKAPDGSKLGTLSIMDHEPRTLTSNDRKMLEDLGTIIEEKFDALSHVMKDSLTGLFNRRGFINTSNKLIQNLDDMNNEISFAYFHLKKLNPASNIYDSAEENQRLIEFSKLLKDNFSGFDIISRIGIDLFCVLDSNLDSNDFVLAISNFKELISNWNLKQDECNAIKYYVGWLVGDKTKCDNAGKLINVMEKRIQNLKFDPHQTLA